MRKLLTVLFAVSLVGCGSKSLRTEITAHPNYNISDLKSYTWATPSLNVVGVLSGAENAELEARVKKGVGDLLNSKGYRLAGAHERPDMSVTVLIAAIAETAHSVHSVSSQRYYSRTIVWSQVNDFLRGAVSIIIRHPENEDIMWQGTVGENLKNTSQGENGQTIRKFTALIGEQLPAMR
jgi:hypothetical protein